MAFELNEAGITFVVGAFTILTFELIVWLLFGKHLTGFFAGRLGLSDNAGVTAGVFFGLSFAVGLLMEDISYKYSDPFVYPPLRVAGAILGFDYGGGGPKGELQRAALLAEFRDCNPTPTALGRSIFGLGLFEALDPSQGASIRAWALHSGPLPPPSRPGERYSGLNDAIAGAFYFAKNRVFSIDNYYDELRRIHSRLEFSRTIAIISVTALVFCLIVIFRGATQRMFLNRAGGLNIGGRTVMYSYRPLRRGALLACAFAILYLICTLAYRHESLEYNNRVFGYYDSMVRAARTAPSGSEKCAELPLP